MTAPFVSRRRVEFADTDMAGMMHFANFFRFMEAAEVDFLHSCGLSVGWRVGGQRFGFPRVAASCDFFMPARFEDVLEIHVVIENVGRKSITWRHEFRRGNDLLARGKITSVCCLSGGDGPLQSIDIPDDVRALLEKPN